MEHLNWHANSLSIFLQIKWHVNFQICHPYLTEHRTFICDHASIIHLGVSEFHPRHLCLIVSHIQPLDTLHIRLSHLKSICGLLIRQRPHAQHTIPCKSSRDTCDLTLLMCPRASHRFNTNPISLSWKPNKTLFANLFTPLDPDVSCDDLLIGSQQQRCALCLTTEKSAPATVFQPLNTKWTEQPGSAEVAIDHVMSHLKSPHMWARLNVPLLAMTLSNANVPRIWLDK